MAGNLSSLYQEIPPRSTAYDYDDPGPPFSPECVAATDAIKAFLSADELAQARRLETVYYNPLIGDGCGIFIPGLRSYPDSLCLYVGRYSEQNYMDMLDNFLDEVYARAPKAALGSLNRPWFRVTTPDGRRNYPVEVSGNLQAWKDRTTEVANDLGTTLAWFDHGKFCLADGRRFSFGDLTTDRMKGGKPIPTTW